MNHGSRIRNRFLFSLLALGALLLSVGQVSSPAQEPGTQADTKTLVYPGKTWERVEKPESVGYSSARPNAMRAWLESLDTTAMMVSVGGRSLFEYGDLPQLDLVIAHKTDTTQVSPHGPGRRTRSVSTAEYDSILRMLIAAKCPGGKCQ